MKLAAKWDYREGLQSMSVAQAVEYEYGRTGGGGQLETMGHAINGHEVEFRRGLGLRALPVHYGSSMLMVVAETIEQARELAKTGAAYTYGAFKQDRVPMESIDGEPTRVVDVPCAEWHKWSE